MANNKVQLANGTVLIDLTNDTVDAEHLFKGYIAHDKTGASIVGTYESGAAMYSVVPKTETWQHNTYVTISVDIGADGSVSAYKSAGGGTANNMVICYPQSDIYVAGSEITKIPFPHEAGEHTIDVTVWWDNQSGARQDHNNHTLTYTVVKTGGEEISVEPLSVTANGTYTAEEGKAYSPVTVSVPSPATQTKSATPSLSAQTISPDSGKLLSSVSVSAVTGELLSSLDSDFVAGNIKKDVNLFGVVGTLDGGSYTVAKATATSSIADTSLKFTVANAPKWFVMHSTSNVSSSSSTARCICIIFDGTNVFGNYDKGTVYYSGTYYSYTLSGNTLTVKSQSGTNGGYFVMGGSFELIYVY